MSLEEPLRHLGQLAGKRRAVVGRELRRRRRATQLDLGKRLQRITVQLLRVAPGPQARQIVRAAQILEQHESLGRVRLVHMRDVDSKRLEKRGHAQIRPHVLRGRRRVHRDEGALVAHHAKVPPEAGITRCGLDPLGAQTQIARQPTLQERESRIVLRHSHIIMPSLMRRWNPFWTALLSFGGLIPLVRADPPPTPAASSTPMTAPTGPTAPRTKSRRPGDKSLASGGPVSLNSDSMVGVNGVLSLKGHVVVRQGARTIRANQLQYNRKNNSLRTQGGIDYTDPLVHVTGAGGSYSPTEGAQFESASFNLVQRSARGAAKEMQLSSQGLIRLEHVTFTTCPVNDQSWVLRATRISLDTRK